MGTSRLEHGNAESKHLIVVNTQQAIRNGGSGAGRGQAALEHDAIARRVRACPACEEGSSAREGGRGLRTIIAFCC